MLVERHKGPPSEGHRDGQALPVANGNLGVSARARVYGRLWRDCCWLRRSRTSKRRRNSRRRNRGRLAVNLLTVCRLEPVNGDRVTATVHVKYVILRMSLEDLERAVIGALQWFAVSIMADVHISSGSEGVRRVG